ncbi:MAG: serine/threonine-protein kinase [Blastocatellia bacterium]|nr:serine/threonine-protein kinase [Blastocatellia bacterium]
MDLTPERWERIEELFHAALERAPGERRAFLAASCGDDAQLLAEVESLIIAHEEPGSFIDSPAYEMVSEEIAGSQPESAEGRIVGQYRILAPIGKGGMGEVYKAKDLRLDRTIALKLLPSQLTENEERLHRFKQEAKVASSLNHPNIITIHEIGEADGTYYIATEFIDGQTLRRRLKAANMEISEALDIAIQAGGALAAAHRAGIVHRDVKPENIMLRPDGYVKMLDFGLATFTEGQTTALDQDQDANLQDISWVNTAPGVIMGTVSYMSPEQARGARLDERTDIFSLGIVLYEMMTGHQPFEGETATDVIASILKTDPPPLAAYLPEAPAEIQWILSKALRKNRDDRYQTVRGMIADLRALKQEMEIQSRLEQSHPSDPGIATVASGASQRSNSLAVSTGGMRLSTTLSTEYILDKISNHTKAAMAVLAMIVVLIAAFGFWLSTIVGTKEQPSPFQTMKITRLTDTGKAWRATISPDGKYVAHVVENEGQHSLWVMQVATLSNVEIIPPSRNAYVGLIFSQDGDYIYYTFWDKKNRPALYQIPALGGSPRKILDNVDDLITFSPEGDRFAFVREEKKLMVADTSGGGERALALRREDEFWRYPAWSPDGKVIACAVGSYSAEGDYVVSVSLKDGTEKTISSQKWFRVYTMSWLSDGSGLVMNAVDQKSKLTQIWSLSYPGGATHRITNDLNNYYGMSLTADSNGLVCVLGNRTSNIWIVPNEEGGLARQVTFESGNDDGLRGTAWAPDGRIVYASGKGGNQDIWIMQPDGTDKTQLTIDPRTDFFPSVSPDGRYIVFASDRGGSFNIWRMDIDGSNPKQLTSRGGEGVPHCSPDSQWVVYEMTGPDELTIWKVPIDGGAPVQLTDRDSKAPVVSPDGKSIACVYWKDKSGASPVLAAIPFEGGPPLRMLDVPSAARSSIIQWSPDGRALTYIYNSGSISNIWSHPLEGGPPKQLTDFKDSQIFSFQWSRDGRTLVCSRGGEPFDVVLIRDFK